MGAIAPNSLFQEAARSYGTARRFESNLRGMPALSAII
jgi:hypothetical protein